MFPVIFISSHLERISCKSVNSDSDSWSVRTDMPKCVWKYVGDRLTWTQEAIFNKVMHLCSVCLFTAFLPTDASSRQITDSSQINSRSVYVTWSVWADGLMHSLKDGLCVCPMFIFLFFTPLRPHCSWQWHDNRVFRKFCLKDKYFFVATEKRTEEIQPANSIKTRFQLFRKNSLKTEMIRLTQQNANKPDVLLTP